MLTKLIIGCLLAVQAFADAVDVDTTSGKVRGRTTQVLGRTVNEFIGIPFAEPPVGELRFAKPRPISTPLPGVIDATTVKHACMQPLIPNPIMAAVPGEDCLHLNIWSPQTASASNATLKPVMFWIYGGAFKFGTIYTPLYNGGVLSTKDVVIVMPNYRLGTFGFLYDGTDAAPGNMGLYDQTLALKWVQDNIHKFGGDKNQVTIFGESAGSWSVSAHLLSPLSKGLFKRAIMESCAVYMPFERYPYTKEDALAASKKFASANLCLGDDWLDCLKKRPAVELVLNLEDLIFNLLTPPVIGTEFLPMSAQQAYKEGKFNQDVDIIAGANKDEGSYLSMAVDPTILIRPYTRLDFTLFVERMKSMVHGSYIDTSKVVDFYLKDISWLDLIGTKKAAQNVISDAVVKCPTYYMAKQYAEHSKNKSNVYFYQLNYGPEFTGKLLGDVLGKVIGVFHAADIISVFGLPYSKLLDWAFSKDDEIMSATIMDYWTTFAKTGKPGNWSPLVSKADPTHDETIKILQPNNLQYSEDLYDKTCDGFWKQYFDGSANNEHNNEHNNELVDFSFAKLLQFVKSKNYYKV